jgi:hypothetical protein
VVDVWGVVIVSCVKNFHTKRQHSDFNLKEI